MNFYPLDFEANRQHRENLEREVKMMRLARLAQQQKPLNPAFKAALTNLGHQLVGLGERLQGVYQGNKSAADISSTNLPPIEAR